MNLDVATTDITVRLLEIKITDPAYRPMQLECLLSQVGVPLVSLRGYDSNPTFRARFNERLGGKVDNIFNGSLEHSPTTLKK